MKLKIIRNEKLCGTVFRLKAERGPMKEARPGQFLQLRCSDSPAPLLRRPFSVAGMDENSFEIIYKIVGAGTRELSRLAAGDVLDAVGPLGNGFPDIMGESVIVAGGMGIAPMMYLAKKYRGHIKKFIYGAKTAEALFCCEEIDFMAAELVKTTDDGTCGLMGDACSTLENCIAGENPDAVFACGPGEMLKKVCMISKEHSVPCFISLENRFACGVGACLGCAVRVFEGGRYSYRRACRDGPVFKGEVIVWESPTSL